MPRKKRIPKRRPEGAHQISQGLWEWLCAPNTRERVRLAVVHKLNRFALTMSDFESLHPIIGQRIDSGALKVVPGLIMTVDDLETLAAECRKQEVPCE